MKNECITSSLCILFSASPLRAIFFSNYFEGIFSSPRAQLPVFGHNAKCWAETSPRNISVSRGTDVCLPKPRFNHCTCSMHRGALAVYPGLSDCAALSPRSLVEVIRNFTRVLITFDNYFLARDMG